MSSSEMTTSPAELDCCLFFVFGKGGENEEVESEQERKKNER